MKTAESWYREGFEALHMSFTADRRSDRDDDLTRGVAAFDEVLRLEPAHLPAWRERGLAMAWLERYGEAVDSFSQALRHAPGDVDLLLVRARVWHKMGAYQDALDGYDEVFRVRPSDPDARYWRAEALDSLERFAEALVAWETWLALEDDGEVSYARRLDRVIIPRRRWRVLETRAKLFVQLGQSEEAIAAFREILDGMQKPVTLLHPYERLIRDHDEALDAYLEYLRENWNDRLSRLHATKSLCKRGRYVEALDACHAWIELVPDDHYAWFEKAEICAALARLGDAIEAYRRALELDPTYRVARTRLEIAEKRVVASRQLAEAGRWTVLGRNHLQDRSYVLASFGTEAEANACLAATKPERGGPSGDCFWIVPPADEV